MYRFYSLSYFKPRFNERRCSIFQDGRKLGFGGMHGIPMVASSPVRHESSIGMTPLEVQAYQPPWKALSDFALHTDLERLDPNTPSFHHLVSQVIIVDIFQIKKKYLVSIWYRLRTSIAFRNEWHIPISKRTCAVTCCTIYP